MRARNPCLNTRKLGSIPPALALIAPFVHYWFFAGCIVLRVGYDESLNGGPYSLAVACLCLACIIYFLVTVLIDKERYRKSCWLYLCCIGLIGASLVANSQIYHQYNYFRNFVAFGAMGICAGLSLSRNERICRATKVLDIVSILCLLGAALFEFEQYSGSYWSARGYAGLSYQTISYMSAVAYSFTLWSLMFARPENHFAIFNRSFSRVVRVAMMLLLVMVSVLSGGRGGVLCIAVVTLVAIIIQIRAGRMGVKAALCIVAIGVAALFALFIWGDVLLNFRGFERILTRGNNRSNVWDMALSAINDSFVLGYGFGGYGRAFDGPYPHNIVLDVALSFGLVGLAILLCVAVYLIKRIAQILDANYAWGALMAMLAAFTLVYLSVSGTFISYAPFWFVISAAISYNDSEYIKTMMPIERADR